MEAFNHGGIETTGLLMHQLENECILRSQLLKRFRQLQELLLSYRQLACALQRLNELVYCL